VMYHSLTGADHTEDHWKPCCTSCPKTVAFWCHQWGSRSREPKDSH